MKKVLFCFFLLIAFCRAQEETLDPSIFDGTGRETEKKDPEKSSSGSPGPTSTPAPAAREENANTPAVEAAEEGTPVPQETEPEEIILPGSGSEEEAETESEAPPGVPAAQGGGKSRAGETVDSTEKIQTGQAVDFPWDM